MITELLRIKIMLLINSGLTSALTIMIVYMIMRGIKMEKQASKQVIAKVWAAKKMKQQDIKFITVPTRCNIKKGDYVRLIKIEE